MTENAFIPLMANGKYSLSTLKYIHTMDPCSPCLRMISFSELIYNDNTVDYRRTGLKMAWESRLYKRASS